MKKLNKLFVTVCALCVMVLALGLFGCGKTLNVVTTTEDKSVVITPDNSVVAIGEDTSLYDYMVALKNDGKLTFTVDDTKFITSVNDTANATDDGGTHGWSWMIYTNLVSLDGDDAVYSTAEYGTYEYNGKSYNQASYGCAGLPCVEGYTYILVYSEWSWNY